MSRYIDADALHDALKAKQKWVVRCGDKHNEGYTYDQVHFTIDDAPSIDIVRCKECKYCKTYYHSYDNIPSRCLRTLNDVNADDFCSYGSRSEKPNNSTTEDCSMVDCEYYKNPDYRRCMECKRKQTDCPWK